MKNFPRSCNLSMEYGMAVPFSMETKLPFKRREWVPLRVDIPKSDGHDGPAVAVNNWFRNQ